MFNIWLAYQFFSMIFKFVDVIAGIMKVLGAGEIIHSIDFDRNNISYFMRWSYQISKSLFYSRTFPHLSNDSLQS